MNTIRSFLILFLATGAPGLAFAADDDEGPGARVANDLALVGGLSQCGMVATTGLLGGVACASAMALIYQDLRNHPNFNPDTFCRLRENFNSWKAQCEGIQAKMRKIEPPQGAQNPRQRDLLFQIWNRIYQLDRQVGAGYAGMVNGAACREVHEQARACVDGLKARYQAISGAGR